MSATATGEQGDRVGARQRRRRFSSGLLRLASDERLVELLRGGSHAAFEALYARHHRGVLSFCRHMLWSAEEAEDAVQHTFLAAFRDIVGSSKEIQLRPWLYAIARNRCLTVLRARRDQGAGEPAEPPTEHLSTEVERRHDLRALLGDVARLPDDQRSALVLAELGDMSHDEIGQALGCPRERVKALVFQARSSLIASREAREAPCAEIRDQLSDLRGGALRRNLLRRHLRECPGCREFRDRVRTQRRELALILPVAPTLGLQAAVLGGGGAVAAGGASVGSVVATTTVVLAVAGGGTVAVETARDKGEPPQRPKRPPSSALAAPAMAGGETDSEPAVPRAPAAAERPAFDTRGVSAPRGGERPVPREAADRERRPSTGEDVPPEEPAAPPENARDNGSSRPPGAAPPQHISAEEEPEKVRGPAPGKPEHASAPEKEPKPEKVKEPTPTATPTPAETPEPEPEPTPAPVDDDSDDDDDVVDDVVDDDPDDESGDD